MTGVLVRFNNQTFDMAVSDQTESAIYQSVEWHIRNIKGWDGDFQILKTWKL